LLKSGFITQIPVQQPKIENEDRLAFDSSGQQRYLTVLHVRTKLSVWVTSKKSQFLAVRGQSKLQGWNPTLKYFCSNCFGWIWSTTSSAGVRMLQSMPLPVYYSRSSQM